MMIFDFITQEEIDELPDDAPHEAFTEFVRTAQRRLGERTSTIDETREGWEELNEARHGFMNVVIAAAKKYQIEPFASLPVPRLTDFGEPTHRQFKADLDHYITQLLLDNSSRAKRDSVFISTEMKTSIQTYIHHLRQAIEQSTDLGEARRNALLKKLAEFEAELEKRRLSLTAVTLLAITFLGAPGAINASAEITTKLITNILRVVGEAKIADDELRRVPSAAPPIAISGPRPNDPDLSENTKPRSTLSEMDDEIPF